MALFGNSKNRQEGTPKQSQEQKPGGQTGGQGNQPKQGENRSTGGGGAGEQSQTQARSRNPAANQNSGSGQNRNDNQTQNQSQSQGQNQAQTQSQAQNQNQNQSQNQAGQQNQNQNQGQAQNNKQPQNQIPAQSQNEMADLQLAVLKQRVKEELKQELKQEIEQDLSNGNQGAGAPDSEQSEDKNEENQGGAGEADTSSGGGGSQGGKGGEGGMGSGSMTQNGEGASGGTEESGQPDAQEDESQKKPGEKKSGTKKPGEKKSGEGSGGENRDAEQIPTDMKGCEAALKNIFGASSDIEITRFQTAYGEAVLLAVDGMVDKDLIDRDIIAPLKSPRFDGNVPFALHTPYSETKTLPETIQKVLDGFTALFFEGEARAYVAELKNFEKRSVESPEAEAVIRGPKEGFNESIRTNTSLLRRKIKTPDLIIENIRLGRQTNTIGALVYVQGIVNTQVLEELKARLAEIDTDAVLETGYIEQYLDQRRFCVIPRTGMTQKPDILAARILEGRVGILCDGTPHALTVPHLFIENLQTAEDYYSRTVLGNFMRLTREVALVISLLLPGLFLAITTFHHEMIPSVFLATVISSVEKTPFPLGAELFLLMVMFELLRESGTRLPRAIGSAISIVGALIIGDAAVSAGIVSAPVVIVVALTAVCGFVNSSLNEMITIYRFFFLFLGGVMGLIGIATGVMFLLVQTSSAESFGIPVLDSFSDDGWKDSIVRFPLQSMKFRPFAIAGNNKRRQK